MHDADARLAAAPAEPGPAGARAQVVPVRRSGTTLVTSGQVAVRDGKLLAEGRVGEDVTLDTARSCARQCARNVLTAVRDGLAGEGGLGAVERVESVTVWVASVPGFTDQHLVADAATDLFVEVLGEEVGRHVRAALGVAALPTGSPVEVQARFRLRDPERPGETSATP
ncbi:RidA family protein [Spongiactinospora sp. TRM90649]|uniref:RidA family protein n=1 Tax=Spongiactinospora sp. TRM90649 TaxID=3031114 RepID=UPI0023F838B5|nr:RidA family protein [Spongiactinospora sp. TRM90649]MDF5756385.1 RidA family protein [Spongiactinospora sp. TRM90649]